MAERSGFFPYVAGDSNSEYDHTFLARFVASFIGNGVYDGTLAVTAGEHMQIILPAGQAWINGYYYRNDSNLALPIENADGVLHRKDTVVLRWDINTRNITVQVLPGTFASNPTTPAITRTAEQYDLKLAEISVPAGTTAITQALITDTRLDNTVCGIVTGVIKQADTTKLYQQIQSDLVGFKSVNEADFTAWVNGLKSVLDADTAGNLLNLINTHKADTAVHITAAERSVWNNKADKSDMPTKATLGLDKVDNTPDADKTVKYAASTGNANTSGTSTYAHYSSHAVGSGSGGAIRNITMSTVAPSGGVDGDVWHQYT